MKAAIIQSDLKWEDKAANLSAFTSALDHLERDTELVVLPEMFTTAFSMNTVALAEPMNGSSVRWMLEQAAARRMAICGSLIISENNKYFNRMLFVTPEREIISYDKRHLHSISGEEKAYSPGREQVNHRFKDLVFNLQICYDLRFPVWSRNRGETDVIIYSANWPRARAFVWKALLVARAIENQCYVLGVNRIGTAPDGTSYSGDSVIISPKGETLASVPADSEGIASAVLSREMIDQYRKDMPVWRDADSFTLNL